MTSPLCTWQTFDVPTQTLHESGELIEILKQFAAAGAKRIDSSPRKHLLG